MDEGATWYLSRPRPRPETGTQLPRESGTAAPHLFGPCLLSPWLPISATAELLFPVLFARNSKLLQILSLGILRMLKERCSTAVSS